MFQTSTCSLGAQRFILIWRPWCDLHLPKTASSRFEKACRKTRRWPAWPCYQAFGWNLVPPDPSPYRSPGSRPPNRQWLLMYHSCGIPLRWDMDSPSIIMLTHLGNCWTPYRWCMTIPNTIDFDHWGWSCCWPIFRVAVIVRARHTAAGAR